MPELWVTCALGPYNFEFMTEVTKEIVSLYKVDGIFSNRWAGSGMCYCEHCRENFHAASGLDLRRPYERGKVPVVLIHGLWGTPHLWDPMIKDLEDDPAIREVYQFWTFRYTSGDSIPYSAHLLRQSLRRARRCFDPAGTDAAFDRMVVVGHSQRRGRTDAWPAR